MATVKNLRQGAPNPTRHTKKNIHNLTYKQIHTQQYKHTNAHKKYAIHHDACITNRVAVSFFYASHASKGIAQDNVRICASIYAFPSPCPLQSERPPSKQLRHELAFVISFTYSSRHIKISTVLKRNLGMKTIANIYCVVFLLFHPAAPAK